MHEEYTKEAMLREYFPRLSGAQAASLMELDELYRFWNQRINVVSRKDIDNLFLHHVVHSLAVSLFMDIPAGLRVIDAGTGGGFPGIPLAIAHPEAEFFLVDSTAKKLNVVDEICSSLGLHNVTTYHMRLEEIRLPTEAIVSRAVSSLPVFIGWVRHLLKPAGPRHRGIFYLKGGEVDAEARETGMSYAVHPLGQRLPFGYFETKKLVHLLP